MPKSIDEIVAKLTEIDGIGPTRARSLISQGVRAPRDLARPEIWATLSQATKLAIKYPRKPISWAMANAFIEALPPAFIGVGSYRRHARAIGDVDLLMLGPIARARKLFESAQNTAKFTILAEIHAGETSAAFYVKFGPKTFRVELYTAPRAERITAMQHWTGNFNHNIRLRAQAKRLGYKLSQHGLFKGARRVPLQNEKHLYALLGVTYVPPEERNE